MGGMGQHLLPSGVHTPAVTPRRLTQGQPLGALCFDSILPLLQAKFLCAPGFFVRAANGDVGNPG